MSPTPATPGGLRPVTYYLSGNLSGEYAARLVLTAPEQQTDPAAWTITHPLGTPAGGTHTEVVVVDDSTANLPEDTVDALVRLLARELYGTRWAFHYRPDQLQDSVLRHGSLLRERIEVSGVEVWT